MMSFNNYVIYYCVDGKPYDIYGDFNSLLEAKLGLDQVTKLYPDEEYQLFECIPTRIS
jgi:hypothetical protein